MNHSDVARVRTQEQIPELDKKKKGRERDREKGRKKGRGERIKREKKKENCERDLELIKEKI